MRVVIADDSAIVREGAARLLQDAGIEVAGQAADAEDLLRKVRAHKPDVAITDIRMPPRNEDDGLMAAIRIRAEMPETGVLVLSQYVEADYVQALLANGADGVGYLLKDRVSDVTRFTEALHRVAGGGSVLDPEVVSLMMGGGSHDAGLVSLTDREREVLAQMAEGRTNRAVATDMSLSERAIERHVTAIFGKLGLEAGADDHRRVLAVLRYLDDA